MNIRPITTSSVAAAAALQAGGTGPETLRSAAIGRTGRPADASADRIELSARGRTEAARDGETPEVETARVALRAGGGLSAERLHSLRERVRTGHYDQPEVIDRLATAAVADVVSGDVSGE